MFTQNYSATPWGRAWCGAGRGAVWGAVWGREGGGVVPGASFAPPPPLPARGGKRRSGSPRSRLQLLTRLRLTKQTTGECCLCFTPRQGERATGFRRSASEHVHRFLSDRHKFCTLSGHGALSTPRTGEAKTVPSWQDFQINSDHQTSKQRLFSRGAQVRVYCSQVRVYWSQVRVYWSQVRGVLVSGEGVLVSSEGCTDLR